MPDTVMITLVWQNQEGDFALPAKLPIKMLSESLKKTLYIHFPRIPLSGKQVVLRSAQGCLSPDRTLEEYGIFDGARLIVELTEY